MSDNDDVILIFPSKARTLNGKTVLYNAMNEAAPEDDVVIIQRTKDRRMTIWSTIMEKSVLCHMTKELDYLCDKVVDGSLVMDAEG